jgi:MoaA/NifB/PqqE/SkfB family radical SAM enzyme
MIEERDIEAMLWRERVANIPKHWVRAVTACNSRCVFCLDSDTPRNVYIPVEEVKKEIDRGRDELGAVKMILSGGEASLHPGFTELIRYAKSRGYERVQTVTNGYRLAEQDFFHECMEAGLGEITFSLHGHTPELHDRLTQTEGAFKRLIKGMVRALRDGRPIVNVDVVINKQNVAVLDKIVELCISLGVTEFDLLHVIPQAAAFDNRAELFYDPREHLPVLQKVFKLNRHPRFVVWTNRFPIPFLEGLEDLIQDPHKMLDEVNGRRFQVRRYLDEGKVLDCRHAERCPHCFIEPFCTTMDRTIAQQNAGRFEVYWVGNRELALPELPYGATKLGVESPDFAGLERHGRALYARVASAEPIPTTFPHPLTLVASSAEQLDAWLAQPLPANVDLDIELNQSTGPWLLDQRELVRNVLDRVRLFQPAHEHMQDATANDVREPRAYFLALDLPIRVSGLPACLAPGALWEDDRPILDAAIFDEKTGRLDIRELSRFHVRARYRGKSVRCADCRVDTRCEGPHINMIRDQGLAMLTPFVEGPAADAIEQRLSAIFPTPPARLANGSTSEPVATSLPGFPEPSAAPLDPLAVIELERQERRAKRALRVLTG